MEVKEPVLYELSYSQEIIDLQTKYGISIPNEDIKGFKTLNDLVINYNESLGISGEFIKFA